jgi:hypothetical protein
MLAAVANVGFSPAVIELTGKCASEISQPAESLRLMLVIIIIMTIEKRQAKNFALLRTLVFPPLGDGQWYGSVQDLRR